MLNVPSSAAAGCGTELPAGDVHVCLSHALTLTVSPAARLGSLDSTTSATNRLSNGLPIW